MKGSQAIFTSRSEEWETPLDLFNELEKEFGPFDLDPCATGENAKCVTYFTKEKDGLKQEWTGKVFLNPPYGKNIGKWMEKARTSGAFTVCLVPARTDTRWWHDNVEGKAEVRFIKGRLRYGGSKWNAPFPSCLVIYRLGINK